MVILIGYKWILIRYKWIIISIRNAIFRVHPYFITTGTPSRVSLSFLYLRVNQIIKSPRNLPIIPLLPVRNEVNENVEICVRMSGRGFNLRGQLRIFRVVDVRG